MSIKTQLRSDKAAMSLSFLCVAHCFFAPSFIILSSAFASFTVDNEFVHKFILFVAVPISIYALYTGYKNHKDITRTRLFLENMEKVLANVSDKIVIDTKIEGVLPFLNVDKNGGQEK